MKWAIIVVVILIALVLLVTLVGAMLPKTHTASRTVRVARRPEEVFDAITNWRSFPNWRDGVKSVRELPQRTGWIEVTRHGELPLEMVQSDRPRTLVTRIADPKLPFGGTWTWRIRAAGDDPAASDVTVTEAGEIYNPVFRFMARFVFGYTATIDAYLKSLTRHLAPR